VVGTKTPTEFLAVIEDDPDVQLLIETIFSLDSRFSVANAAETAEEALGAARATALPCHRYRCTFRVSDYSRAASAVATAPSGEGVGKANPAELTVIATNGQANGHLANGNGKSGNGNGGGGITLALGNVKVAFATQGDAPSCMDCGAIMVRNGSCYKCLNCGSTSGCS